MDPAVILPAISNRRGKKCHITYLGTLFSPLRKPNVCKQTFIEALSLIIPSGITRQGAIKRTKFLSDLGTHNLGRALQCAPALLQVG